MWHWHLQISPSCPCRITAELSLFEVTGLSSNRPAPTLLSSRRAATKTGSPLLSILFETNPLEESADQRFHVKSQPLEIIYDAVSGIFCLLMYVNESLIGIYIFVLFLQLTVNGVSAFFRLPDDVQLDEFTKATLMKLEQFKDRTATGEWNL